MWLQNVMYAKNLICKPGILDTTHDNETSNVLKYCVNSG